MAARRPRAFRNFSPFHWIGLCDAVAIIPASAREVLDHHRHARRGDDVEVDHLDPAGDSADAAASRTQKPLGPRVAAEDDAEVRAVGGCDWVLLSHAANAVLQGHLLITTGGVSVPPIVPRPTSVRLLELDRTDLRSPVSFASRTRMQEKCRRGRRRREPAGPGRGPVRQVNRGRWEQRARRSRRSRSVTTIRWGLRIRPWPTSAPWSSAAGG